MLVFRIKKIAKDTEGALTVFGLFMLMTCIVIGGLALDVSNAYLARTQLQATTDAAAHTALYVRDGNSESAAITAALDVVEQMMPAAKFGNVITASDIQFGTWDNTVSEFSASAGSKNAVFVDANRSNVRNNPVGTYFLRFLGFDKWDVRRGAVYETYIPGCTREGFMAIEPVDIQSNNIFRNGFCIHSNTHVEVNNNGLYETGVVVSMPDRQDLVLPASGFSSNTGLQAALRDGSYQFRILNQLPTIMAGLEALNPAWLPSYITATTVKPLSRSAPASDYVPGGVYKITCNGGQKVTFNANTTLTNVVVVTNCEMHFAKGGTLVNSIIATTNTKSNSINAGSLFTLGLDDSCAAGGGSQILTMGGVDFAAGLESYGGQIIAMDDIVFSANATGIEGISLISKTTVSGTSNMTMGFCGGDGMDGNFSANYFRLVS